MKVVMYYGEALPNLHATRTLTDCDVVLQPYHPLVRSAQFEAYFPDCRRFVYWNPTGIYGERLIELQRPIRLEHWDPRWKIARFDLTDEATQDYVVDDGIEALGPDRDIHGLFVDDLDLWTQGRRRPAIRRVLDRVAAKAGADFSWFFNRGFPLWPDTPHLHAVLLEELTPYDVEQRSIADAVWINRAVLRPLEKAKRAGVRAYALTYGIDEPPPMTLAPVSARLAGLTDETIYGKAPNLAEWPKELR